MPAGAPQAYRYRNPDVAVPAPGHLDLATFDIVPSLAVDGGLEVAGQFQEITSQAGVDAYKTYITSEQIGEHANPENQQLVEEQAKRVRAAGRTAMPYFEARLPGVAPPSPGAHYIGGFGHAELAHEPSFLKGVIGMLRRGDQAIELVDLGNLFVRPGLQGNGIGVATLFSMLDTLHDTTPTTVLIATGVNRHARTDRFKSIGFEAIHEHQPGQPKVFGQAFNLGRFDGPPVGDLRQVMIDRAPWLAQRESIKA